jgi:hypothetical protein
MDSNTRQCMPEPRLRRRCSGQTASNLHRLRQNFGPHMLTANRERLVHSLSNGGTKRVMNVKEYRRIQWWYVMIKGQKDPKGIFWSLEMLRVVSSHPCDHSPSMHEAKLLCFQESNPGDRKQSRKELGRRKLSPICSTAKQMTLPGEKESEVPAKAQRKCYGFHLIYHVPCALLNSQQYHTIKCQVPAGPRIGHLKSGLD